MLSQEAIQKLLGIEEKVYVTPETMADKLNVTFFPHQYDVSRNVESFAAKLREIFSELKVNVVPYEQAIENVSYKKIVRRIVKVILNDTVSLLEKIFGFPRDHRYIELRAAKSFLKRRRLKKGIAVVALGEQKAGNLPMEYVRNFKDNSVISILDFPKQISEASGFQEHFDIAMDLFAYHMTNIVIAVDSERWMLYNFNASHPIYPIDKSFKKNILHSLIPKVVAPISPHKFSDFTLLKEGFDPKDGSHKNSVQDIVEGALLFGQTNLYPVGKKIDELSFRNSFYRSIGKLHLDNRNGMSFGFLARQMPSALSEIISVEEAQKRFGSGVEDNVDYFTHNSDQYIVFVLDGRSVSMKVPAVWVLSQRSGSDKTRVVPERDLVKLGLSNGVMYLQTPEGLKLNDNYRPSFDTKVILAHALGNAIVASILKYKNPKDPFALALEHDGLGLAHWHGYFNPDEIPEGLQVYGIDNPHVACSSPQSAIYAIDGKLIAFMKVLGSGKAYMGDIHVEPQHGSNVSFVSLVKLAQFLIEHSTASVLGNRYLYLYNTLEAASL